VRCAEALRVQAYFDAEVDAVSASEIERHLEHCADCRALLEDLEQVRSSLRRDAPYLHAPPPLRARILGALDQETAPPASRPRRRERILAFWAGALSGVGGSAIAAMFAFLLIVPRFASPLLEELTSAHLRSLMPAHLIDVVSTDKHTVKPWFSGHADVSPAVADFDAQGYKLIGGRADYLDHQRSAVVVYQHGAHVINVFSWAADRAVLPADSTRGGYHFVFWKVGDLAYCAVSDTGWGELQGLVRLLKELPR
jgi:anti-sigma factor RsiW